MALLQVTPSRPVKECFATHNLLSSSKIFRVSPNCRTPLSCHVGRRRNSPLNVSIKRTFVNRQNLSCEDRVPLDLRYTPETRGDSKSFESKTNAGYLNSISLELHANLSRFASGDSENEELIETPTKTLRSKPIKSPQLLKPPPIDFKMIGALVSKIAVVQEEVGNLVLPNKQTKINLNLEEISNQIRKLRARLDLLLLTSRPIVRRGLIVKPSVDESIDKYNTVKVFQEKTKQYLLTRFMNLRIEFEVLEQQLRSEMLCSTPGGKTNNEPWVCGVDEKIVQRVVTCVLQIAWMENMIATSGCTST